MHTILNVNTDLVTIDDIIDTIDDIIDNIVGQDSHG